MHMIIFANKINAGLTTESTYVRSVGSDCDCKSTKTGNIVYVDYQLHKSFSPIQDDLWPSSGASLFCCPGTGFRAPHYLKQNKLLEDGS